MLADDCNRKLNRAFALYLVWVGNLREHRWALTAHIVAAVLGGCAGLPGGAGGTTPPAAGGVLDMCSLATLEEVSGWLQRDAQVWDELTGGLKV